MKLTLKALTVVLTMALVVVLAGDVLAQRGRGGEGRGLGPGGGAGGGVPGSTECINASPGWDVGNGCPYFGTGKGSGMGYGRSMGISRGISRQSLDSEQKPIRYGRGWNDSGFGRGKNRR